MKILVRIALVGLALLALSLGALAVLLPRILDSDAVRSQIESAARDALGREVRYSALDVGLLPPSLLVEEPSVAGEGPDDAPLVEARRVALRIALAPLLAATVVVDELVVEGATLRLTRTPQGLELPVPPGPAAPEEAEAPADTTEESLALALRELSLRDAVIVLDDRAVAPPVTWKLAVDASARGSSLDDPIDLDATIGLASGGTIRARGTATLAGELDFTLDLDALELGPAAPYLGTTGEDALEGRVGGTVAVQGPAANPSRVAADLELEGARFRLEDIAFRGPVTLRAEITDAVERPDGSFALDASRAELRYGDVFTKPPGDSAEVSGRIVGREGGGFDIEVKDLRIHNLQATAQVRTAPSLRVTARTQPIELEGWEALVPSLADTGLSGSVRAEELVVTTEPLAVRGVVDLNDVTLKPSEGEPLLLRGAIVAEGNSARTRDLVVVAAKQALPIDARVTDLFGTPRYAASVRADALNTNALVTAFAGKPNTIEGPLSLNGDVRGSLSSSPLETLQGSLDFDIERGRLVGVSLLQATMQQLGGLGNLGVLALDAGQIYGGRDLQRFYGDEFELVRGDLQVADGVGRVNVLTLVYQGYSADLKGTLMLRDLSLDMTGTITLSPELDAILARNAGAPASYQPQARTLPFAAVGGTLDAPKVQIPRNAAVHIAAGYARDVGRDQLKEVVEGELGEGSGVLVDQGLEVLEGLFGGSKRK